MRWYDEWTANLDAFAKGVWIPIRSRSGPSLLPDGQGCWPRRDCGIATSAVRASSVCGPPCLDPVRTVTYPFGCHAAVAGELEFCMPLIGGPLNGLGTLLGTANDLRIQVNKPRLLNLDDVIAVTAGSTVGARAMGDLWWAGQVTSGADVIIGANGNDTIWGDFGAIGEFGLTGWQTVALGGEDTLYGGQGDDRLYGGGNIDLLFGQAGNDSLYGGLGTTGPQADSLIGGLGNDMLYGDGGDDYLVGDSADGSGEDAGNDMLYGAAGRDSLFGEAGNDQLFGGADADDLRGGTGLNELSGGTGDDYLSGGIGADTLYGGGGADTLFGDDSESSGTTGRDLLNGGGGADAMVGGSSGDTLYGGTGDDTLEGGGFQFDTSDGSDLIFGGRGADRLSGEGGNDTLFGGTGADTLTGGSGSDDFVFNKRATGAFDQIVDFEDGVDDIVLDNDVFAVGAALEQREFASVLGSFGFIGLSADVRIVHDSQFGAVYYDPDGPGGVQWVPFAQVRFGVDLSHSDFSVID